MSERILSISGLRGVIGDGLDPAYVARFAMAVGTMAAATQATQSASSGEAPTVVLARDGRATGLMIRHAALAGLTAAGCRVVDLGVATTPSCGVVVKHLGAAGGLQITASHNPVQWNGLKPFSPEGGVFNEELGRALLALLESGAFRLASWDKLGGVEERPELGEVHLQKALARVDAAAIRARRFRVVLDCNHGSGGVLTPRLLESLGCQVEVLGGTPDGRFEHVPEPTAENLTGLCDVVRQSGADVGFAQDPDADRLAIVDNTGRYIGEELTLALAADHVLAGVKGPVVVNGSTSRVTADVAAKHGCPFHRSYVGEAHVVAKMKAVGAVLGGEGNGGVIEPQVGFVRDSFVGIAYVLAGMAERSRPLSAWVDELPRYHIVKDKLTCPRDRVDLACAALKAAFSDATAQAGDGLRLDWPDRWVQVRASNTEPILRVISEAPEADAARTLCGRAMDAVRAAVGG